MEIIFFVKPLITKSIEMFTGTFTEKCKIKRKLKKIKDFQRGFDNTIVDTNTFQNFLDKEETGNLIFSFVFSAKYIAVDKETFVEELSNLVLDEINNYRKSHSLKKIEGHPVINKYFKDLIQYLEDFRDQSFNSNEMSILANIQNSIMENNENIKKTIEKNLEDILQRSYLKIFTDEKIKKTLERNILNLGKRYNSKANVETDFNLLFNSLASEQQIFDNLKMLFASLKTVILNLISSIENNKSVLNPDDFSRIFDLWDYFKEIDLESRAFYSEDNLNKFVEEITRNFVQTDYAVFHLSDKGREIYKEEINSLVNEMNINSRELLNYIDMINPKLLNQPYLLVHGEGGIGKSHLLADNAKRLQKNGHIVFLFLGQHFNAQDDPFKQIFKLLDFKGTKENFLNEFNSRAEKKNRKVIIMIDALNEGAGKIFWKNYLLDFLNLIKEFENISVVLSVRSNFLRSILPENIEEDFPLTKINYMGFSNLSLKDLEPFFNYYKMDPVLFPSLENECYNPLFLQIYCEVIQEKYEGYRGWSILEFLEIYVKKINTRLSTDQRFQFLGSVNLVDNILREIAQEFIRAGSHYISLDKFYKILKDVAGLFTNGYREIALGLEEENIITVSVDYQGENIVYFTYERFADIYIALIILKKYKEDQKIFEKIISEDNSFYYGTYEALSIATPEKLRLEFLDLIDSKSINYGILEHFVRGLSWRNVLQMNERTLFWVNLCFKQEDVNLKKLVYERLLKHSYIKESPINAEYLTEHLNSLTMSSRDGDWSIFINDNSDVPRQLVDIILKENLSYKHFNYENIELLTKTISWLLTSSNQRLRDSATTALVKIFINEPTIILKNINWFICVNDPYVLERVFASSYGAILRSVEIPDLEKIVEVIYSLIFQKDEVYPNILVRDYARGIILFAHERKIIDIENYEKINPPYSSVWYEKEYTLKDVDDKLLEMQKVANRKYCGFDKIVASMITEHGRGIGGYGDFGRYVFGSALSGWGNQFNDQVLSNIATMRIAEYGYSENIHGYYDNNLTSQWNNNTVERIGKKYQWIALFELLAKLTDNYPMYEEVKIYSSEYNEYQKKLNQRLYFDLLSLTKEDEDQDGELIEEIIEKELNEEDHLLEIKREYKINYNGPWNPFLRNIDPTLLKNAESNNKMSLFKNNLPEEPDKNWAQTKDEFEYLNDFMFYEYEGNNYISLGQLLVQERANGEKLVDKDEFVVNTKALFISKADKKKYIKLKSKNKNHLSVTWPSSYKVFAFEYYWHPSFKDVYYKEKYENIDCEDAIWEYLWENNINFDTGERASYSYLLPNADLVKFFDLIQTSEGVWRDRNKCLVAFDSRCVGYESNLLFRTDFLEKYLEENQLCLVWDFYMEKRSARSRKAEWFLVWVNNNDSIQSIILDEHTELEMRDRF